MSCGQECDCESEEAHDAAMEEAQREFLRDPGPPPAGMSPESVERAERGMAAARKKRGM